MVNNAETVIPYGAGIRQETEGDTENFWLQAAPLRA